MTRKRDVPCRFFCGTDLYQAEESVEALHAEFSEGGASDFPLERFYLDETPWSDILDCARTLPLLFSPGRVIVVKAPEVEGKDNDGEGDGRKGKKSFRELMPEDEKILSAYLASPPDRTVLAVIVPGESKRPRPLIKFFKSRPSSQVEFVEIRPLKDRFLKEWVASRSRRLGKTFEPEALEKFCELSSGDLRRMDGEIGKLAVFVGEKKNITLEDVEEIVPWVITIGAFDIDDALLEGDFRRCLAVLDAYFSSGKAKPEPVTAKIIEFFGKVMQARLLLAEGGTDKEIFFKLYPFIQEKWVKMYREKFVNLFAAVKCLGPKRLNALIQTLREADVLLKRTDLDPRILIDPVLFGYCRMRMADKVRRSSWRTPPGSAG